MNRIIVLKGTNKYSEYNEHNLQYECFIETYLSYSWINVWDELCVVDHVAQVNDGECGEFLIDVFYSN